MRKLFLILMTLATVSLGMLAQTRKVSGTVIDASNGEPCIGATVMPIGGGQGAATDIDGHFSITVPANVKSAKFSYVGYHEQTVALSDKMVVKLQPSSTNLDDVVVVAYGTANKESLTGSVAVVGASEIEERPVTSVTAALEGNAPGVMVNSSTGAPGSAPSIRIRGFNSFSAASPIYVVDGIVYEGDPADINPADVESMSVLKDAASCALYGSRGANGVVLITTKKAKTAGKVDVTVQVREGAYTRGLPFYDRLDAKQWMEASLLANANGSVTKGIYATQADAILGLKDRFVTSYCSDVNVFDKANNEIFDENGKIVAGLNPGYTDLDWWDAISQTGLRQEYSVNAAGATEKFNVFTSVGYLKEHGYLLATDFERFTARVNANYNPVSYFRTGVNLNMSYVNSQVGEADSGNLDVVTNPFLTMFYAPIRPYYAHDEEGAIMYGADGSPIWNTGSINKGDNIAWTMRLNKNSYKSNTLDGSIYGTAVIPYGFEATVRASMYRTMSSSLGYSNNLVGSQKGLGGLDESFGNGYSYTFSQAITWNHDYGVNHVDVLLNHENFKTGSDGSFVRMSGQLMPNIYALSNFEEPTDAIESISSYAIESYLGRARYNYDQKYFGEVSLRRDGTSQFAKNNRWGTFWSVGASWIISREKFMQNLNWVNYLKLRAAYGSVGNNAAAGAYSYMNLYGFNQGTILPVQIGAPDLKWEATKTLDLALEGSLFNDRFNFSVGWFHKTNSDLIFPMTLSASEGTLGVSGGNPTVLKNIGTMLNRGWELQFGVDIIRNRNVKWDFSIDASFIENKIKKLPNDQDDRGNGWFLGYSLYEKYTYEWAGVDQMNGRSLYAMNPDSPDFYYYDDNNKRVYNDALYAQRVENAKKDGSYVEIDGKPYTYKTEFAGRKIMGSALPVVFGSFGTNVSWKGLNVGLLFTYSLGGWTFDSNYASLMRISADSPSALHADVLKAWSGVPEGMTENSKNRIDPKGVPQLNTTLSEYSCASSSQYLTSSSYLTLKNINVSYDLPKKWSSALLLQNINVGFFMDNVFIAAHRKGMNPTYGYAGGQGAYYVPNRTYTFQVSVKF